MIRVRHKVLPLLHPRGQVNRPTHSPLLGGFRATSAPSQFTLRIFLAMAGPILFNGGVPLVTDTGFGFLSQAAEVEKFPSMPHGLRRLSHSLKVTMQQRHSEWLACLSTAHLLSLSWPRSKGTSGVSRSRFGTHVCTSLASATSFSAVAAVPEPSPRVQLTWHCWHFALRALVELSSLNRV